MPALRAFLPGGVDAAAWPATARRASARTLHEAERTLLIAVALVIVVVLLFLASFRAAIIPVAAVPVALIGSFAVMYLWGFSLNNLSLMALIVATGLVVDDAIVVLENISRHVEAGMPPFEAALIGAREVGCDAALDEPGARRRVRLDPVHGRHRRAAVPRVLDHAGRGHPDLARRLAHADADAVRAMAGPSPHEQPSLWQRTSDRAFGALLARLRPIARVGAPHAPLVICLLLGVMALNVHLYIVAPKSFLPQQDTGQLGGFIRGDDGMSFQVMQPKIDAVPPGRARPIPAVAERRRLHRRRPRHQQRLDVRPAEAARRAQGLGAGRRRPTAARRCRTCRRAQFWMFVDQDIRFGGGGDGGGGYEYTLLADDTRLLRVVGREGDARRSRSCPS